MKSFDEKEVRALFEALGKTDYADAAKTSRKRLTTKLNSLMSMEFEVDPDTLDKPNKLLFKSVTDALSEGAVEIAVEAGEEAATNGHTNGKAIKPAKEKKTPKDGKEKVGKDLYGNRIGSEASTINMALKAKAKTAEVIAQETGLTVARVKNHLAYWKKKGTGVGAVLSESDKGWSVTKS